MDIKVEVSVPVDDKRAIWLTGHAEDVELDDVAQVTSDMSGAVAKQALDLYDHAVPQSELEKEAARIVEQARKTGGREEIPPSQRRPRPDDPPSMATFGEEGD